MARDSRKKGESGFYCISCIGTRTLFKDSRDFEAFKSAMFGCGYDIAAYALSARKAYFIIAYDYDRLGTVIQSICIKYAKYYNAKYGCKGKLFHDRYKSCPLEYEQDIVDAVRFLNLLNGETSIDDYEGKAKGCNTEYVLKISADFMKEPNVVRDIKKHIILNYRGEKENIKYLTGMNPGSIKKLPKAQRDEKLAILKQVYSIRRIEELTGISRGVVFNAKRGENLERNTREDYWML